MERIELQQSIFPQLNSFALIFIDAIKSKAPKIASSLEYSRLTFEKLKMIKAQTYNTINFYDVVKRKRVD